MLQMLFHVTELGQEAFVTFNTAIQASKVVKDDLKRFCFQIVPIVLFNGKVKKT